jgi:hypothetical protein
MKKGFFLNACFYGSGAIFLRATAPSFGGSRTGTTGFQFLKIAPYARSAVMGGSVPGHHDDVSALYWNPAGITKTDTQDVHLQLSQTLYFADVSMSYAAVVHQVSKQTYLGSVLFI